MKDIRAIKIETEFIEFIHRIVARPAMYGVNRVEDLEVIIQGYQMGSSLTKTKILSDFLHEFRVFINTEFDYKKDAAWRSLIRFYSGGDNHSLSLFSELFSKFLTVKKNRH